MAREFPWLPVGTKTPGGGTIGRVETHGHGFQIVKGPSGGESTLLVEEGSRISIDLRDALAGMSQGDRLSKIEFGHQSFLAVTTSADSSPICIGELPKRLGPPTAPDLQSLGSALESLVERVPEASWHDAVYLSEFPIAAAVTDNKNENRRRLAISLLTGGVDDPNSSIQQINALNTWLMHNEIQEFLDRLGVGKPQPAASNERKTKNPDDFSLPGRPELENLFREYVIDHYWREDQYAALGVKPPGGILLYGPPGTGKSFAVRKLADFLAWPVFEIDMGAVGSPYIHQTSVMIRKVFEQAFKNSPSLILIDEVDSLIGDRGAVGQDHKVEEISEFLRLVEQASEKGTLVMATTNRKDAVDGAMRRRGRFDHTVEVSYPGIEEIACVIDSLLAVRPHVGGLNLSKFAERLTHRPLSDVAWVVNESARIAVKAGKKEIDDICLFQAISKLT